LIQGIELTRQESLSELRSNVKAELELGSLRHDQTNRAPGVSLSTGHSRPSSFGRFSIVTIWPEPLNMSRKAMFTEQRKIELEVS
jgi:hypothetical protein